MKSNLSTADRLIRALIAVALIVLAAVGVLTGVGAILAYVVGVVFLFTAAIAWCPIYSVLGIKTRKA